MSRLLIRRLADAIPRQCGSTEAAAGSGALVLCRDAREAQRLRSEYSADAVTISDPDLLRGRRVPMVMDVSALGVLAADAELECFEKQQDLDVERMAHRRTSADLESLGRRFGATMARVHKLEKARAVLTACIVRLVDDGDVTSSRVAEAGRVRLMDLRRAMRDEEGE